MAEYHRAASCDEIQPGQGISVKLADRCVAIFNVDGEYHAIDDICPHMGASLASGPLNQDLVMCPWHAWTFNVKTGCFAVDDRDGVESFPLKVEGDEIFVQV